MCDFDADGFLAAITSTAMGRKRLAELSRPEECPDCHGVGGWIDESGKVVECPRCNPPIGDLSHADNTHNQPENSNGN